MEFAFSALTFNDEKITSEKIQFKNEYAPLHMTAEGRT